MAANGSPEFVLTWKTLDMPAGPPICALRASERRTGGNVCIGWRSPQASDGEGGVMEIRPDCAGKYKLRDEAALCGWPTPQANKNTKNSKDPKRMKENGSQTCLADAAHLAPWPTPEAEEARRGFQNRNNGKLGTQKSLTTVAVESLTPWPTPQCMDTLPPMDYERRLNHPSRPGRNVSGNLREVVTLAAWPTPQEDNANNSAGHKGTTFSDLPTVAGWATPRAEDAESAGMRHSRGVADTLSAQAGQDAASSSAATAKPAAYRLNPRFSLWLMGFPDAWASCGEQAMQSSRRSPKPSSAPGSPQPQPQTPQKGTRHETI